MNSVSKGRIQLEELDAEAFAPFGTIVQQPQGASDAGGPGWRWWGEQALLPSDARAYQVGYLALEPAPLQFDWAERHMQTRELLFPLSGDCAVYVAPAEFPDHPDRLPPLDTFRAFRVRAGQGVLLHTGVWHGAPLALDRPVSVAVILLQHTGTQDLYLVRFEDSPLLVAAQGEQSD